MESGGRESRKQLGAGVARAGAWVLVVIWSMGPGVPRAWH